MQQLRASLALHHGRAISVAPRRRVSRSGPVVRRSVSRQEAVAEAAAAKEKLRAANFDPDAASVLTTVFPLWTVINKDIEAAVKPLATKDDLTQAFSQVATKGELTHVASEIRKLTDKLAEKDKAEKEKAEKEKEKAGNGTMAIGMAVGGVLGMVAVVVIDTLLT